MTAYIVDVRDVEYAGQLLDAARSGRRVYLVLFSDECYRNPACYDVEYITRSDAPGYGLILDRDAAPGHIRGWRVRGCALWRDYDLAAMLIEARPDLLVVSTRARDDFLRDAAVSLADELGITVRETDADIPGDVMAVFREGREGDVIAYLERAVERLRGHAGL
jgi:hypothetical protein